MESIWRQAPFLKLVIPLIVGVTSGFYLPLDSAIFQFLIGAMLLCLIILMAFAKKWKFHRYQMVFGVISSTALILAGVSLSLQQRLNEREALILPQSGEAFVGQVLEYPQVKERSVSLLFKLKAKSQNGEMIPINDVQIVSYSPHELQLDTLIPGDLVVFSSKPQDHKPASNPGQFDYGKYLLKNGIAGTVYFHENVHVERPQNHRNTLTGFLHEMQNRGVQIFKNSGMEQRELGVASALILGKRSLIPNDTSTAYAIAGAVHVLAVSGLHVGIIYLVILSLLQKVFPGKKWSRLTLGLTLLFLWIYAGITGFSPSVLRATVMFSFIAFGKHKGHRSNTYNTLAASAFLLIVWNPSIVTEVGFQLSYLAVIGIVYFYKPIYKLFVFKNWMVDKAWALTVVSFGAQLATFPLSVYYFGQFPNLSFFTNLVVIPMATLGLYAGLLTIVLSFIPFVSTAVAFGLKWSLWGLNTFIEWAAQLPIALSDNLYFSLKVVVLLYLLMILLPKFYHNPRKWNLWLPLIVIFLLTTTWVVRKVSVTSAVEISVLEGSKESNLILRQGRSAIVFTRDTSQAQLQSSKFYLDGYFDTAGIDKVEWKIYDSNEVNADFAVENGVVFFNGRIISHWNSPKSENNTYLDNPDLVILSRGFKESNDSFFHPGSTYIIDSSVPYYQRLRLIETFVRNDITFWDMHYQGAFFDEPAKALFAQK